MGKRLYFIGSFFYVGWFGCVFLAKTSYSQATLIFPLILLAFLLWSRELSWPQAVVVAALSVVGILFDSLAMNLQLISASQAETWLIPAWLISIWLLFALSMIKIGVLFRASFWISCLLGFIFGPLSYKSGEAFKVLEFLSPWTFWVYGVFWALFFPAVLRLSKRFS